MVQKSDVIQTQESKLNRNKFLKTTKKLLGDVFFPPGIHPVCRVRKMPQRVEICQSLYASTP